MSDRVQDEQQHRVAVIVLVYNDPVFGKRAVQSVLDQTYKNVCVKVLENGSLDRTRQVLSEFRSDSRVEIVNNGKNLRSEFACRYALDAESEYLAFLFSDDVYDQRKLELQVKFLDEHPECAAVFSNNQYMSEKGAELFKVPRSQYSGDVSLLSRDEHLRHFFFRGNSLHPCAMLIRTDVYRELGGFRGYLHHLGDMVFFTRLLGQYPVGFMPEKLQTITVWSNGRNESSRNVELLEALSFERILFLDTFLEPALFNRLPEIFDSKFDVKQYLSTDADRLWYLGHQAMRSRAFDYRHFGMRCIYNAIKLDESAMNRKTLACFGKSAGEYVTTLINQRRTPAETIVRSTVKLLKVLTPIRWLYGFLFGKSLLAES